MPGPQQRLGPNLILASALAFLSYVPFEWVAKGSLVASALLFIIDPLPPISRLLALLTVALVGVLGKAHAKVLADAEAIEIVDDREEKASTSNNQKSVSKKEN